MIQLVVIPICALTMYAVNIYAAELIECRWKSIGESFFRESTETADFDNKMHSIAKSINYDKTKFELLVQTLFIQEAQSYITDCFKKQENLVVPEDVLNTIQNLFKKTAYNGQIVCMAKENVAARVENIGKMIQKKEDIKRKKVRIYTYNSKQDSGEKYLCFSNLKHNAEIASYDKEEFHEYMLSIDYALYDTINTAYTEKKYVYHYFISQQLLTIMLGAQDILQALSNNEIFKNNKIHYAYLNHLYNCYLDIVMICYTMQNVPPEKIDSLFGASIHILWHYHDGEKDALLHKPLMNGRIALLWKWKCIYKHLRDYHLVEKHYTHNGAITHLH